MGTTIFKAILACLITITLMACVEQKTESLPPIAIESGDECQVCGMLINRLPGPKGQVIFDHQHVKFCSTRDMVSFIHDEENTHRVSQVFVHDMASNDWQNPDPAQFIEGRNAWYVEGSTKSGGMGPTFASFLNKKNAIDFSKEFGGEVKNLTQLTKH
jgi:copper chaperone NosL